MENERQRQPGLASGFHYGTPERPCNGVLHGTDRKHEDGRQVYVCDACGQECVKIHNPRAREDALLAAQIWNGPDRRGI